MPDGGVIHIVEREDEVPNVKYDYKAEKYTDEEISPEIIKLN